MSVALPYPNMDFTPLDILTAAEMDKMVANDQYLANFCAGLADGTNIGNGVIQLSKLKLKIQGGQNNVVFQPDNTGGGFTTINFPAAFNDIPFVVATPSTTDGQIANVKVTNITKTSFTFLARTTGSVNFNGSISWIAISPNG